MTTIKIELERGLTNLQIAKIKDCLTMIRGVVGISGEETYEASFDLNHSSHGQVIDPEPAAQAPVDFENLNPAQKKHIISRAITWGSINGKITLEELENLSPEEMLSRATEMLADMSDAEKNAVFSSIV